jgi:MurNAc alpha-1-phosphate uridylyltransferase
MHALLLAAGRGERMRPLTDTVAKPLLEVAGRRLIEWQIDALVRAGITDLVINTAHLAEQIEAALGDGARYGARIAYSREGTRAQDALEALGGIMRALPRLGTQPFLVLSSDILTEFDYHTLFAVATTIEQGHADAHLVLVDNPPYHPQGDMGITFANPAMPGAPEAAPGAASIAWATRTAPLYTYANIGVMAPRLFAGHVAGPAAVREKLFPWLFGAVEQGRVSAQRWQGRWWNVGTPQDLADVDKIWP